MLFTPIATKWDIGGARSERGFSRDAGLEAPCTRVASGAGAVGARGKTDYQRRWGALECGRERFSAGAVACACGGRQGQKTRIGWGLVWPNAVVSAGSMRDRRQPLPRFN